MTVAPIREWPGPMTRRRTRSNFSARQADRLELLSRELRQLGAKNAELLVAIDAGQFRVDGKPYANARADHPGVILSFDTSKLGHLSWPCDTYDRWEDNLYAVARTLEALRAADRHGVTKHGEQYRGFLALESGIAVPAVPFTHEPHSVRAWLGELTGTDAFEWNAAAGNNGASAATRNLLRKAQAATHPDRGGDPEQFRLVTLAEQYLREANEL